eukprot:8126136-Alexandrium_andersonii.AAC.1
MCIRDRSLTSEAAGAAAAVADAEGPWPRCWLERLISRSGSLPPRYQFASFRKRAAPARIIQGE